MDRYELNVKMEQIKKLARQKEYAAASKIADTIDFYRIKENKSLQLLADVYEASGKYNQAKEILIEAYARTSLGRQLAYRLVRLCIKSKNINEAEDFYDDFINAAPKDNSKYILQYELATAKGRSLEERIKILETYLSDDMDEKWAFELARLYHKSGQKEKCVRQCDDIILWFNDGKYVDKAMELKMLYKPLSKSQQEKYEKRWRAKAPSNVNVDEIKVKEYDAANKYNTVNIQNALKKSMDIIMNEEDIHAEEPKDLEKTKVIPSGEEANSLLSYTVKDVTIPEKYNTVPLSPMLDMDSDGQIELNIEDEPVDDQIEGQITIGELLDNYEKREAMLKEQRERENAAQETKRLYNTEEIGSQIEQVIMETDFDDEDIEEPEISEDLLEEVAAVEEAAADTEAEAGIAEHGERDHKEGLGGNIPDVTKDISNIIHIAPTGLFDAADTSYYSRPKEDTAASDNGTAYDMESENEAETEPETNEAPQYAFAIEPEAAINEESRYTFAEEPQYTFGEEPETVQNEEPQYTFNEEPETVRNEEPQYTFGEEPDTVLNEEPQYTFGEEPDTVQNEEPQYTFGEEPDTVLNEEPQYTFGEEPDTVLNEEPEYNFGEEPDTVLNEEPEYTFGEEPDTVLNEEPEYNFGEEPDTISEKTAVKPVETNEAHKEKEAEEKENITNEYGGSEVKELIKDFVAKYSGVQGLDRQLLAVLQQVLLNHNTNLIVMGEVKSGKTALAIDLIKIINKIQQTRGRKIAKINGEVLNEGNVSEYFEKLEGMDIIVEKAGSLKAAVAAKIIDETESGDTARIIVLEDEKSSIETFLKENSRIDRLFEGRVVVKQNRLQDWALVAQRYANSQGYEIDEMGILALHARINELYAFSLLIGKKQVEEIVDNAIKRSKNRKMGKILKLFGREREKRLKEEDFS